MNIWYKLLDLLGLQQKPNACQYMLEESLQVKLADLALQEGRTEEQVVEDLLAAGLRHYSEAEHQLEAWQLLSPREQDVTALACLGYTNRQIAAHLGISSETVKTHLGNILAKLKVHGRDELRILFSDWNFSAWNTK